jgi:hypothetical protein
MFFMSKYTCCIWGGCGFFAELSESYCPMHLAEIRENRSNQYTRIKAYELSQALEDFREAEGI